MTPATASSLNLLVVGLLTGLGFASVYIARQDVVSTESLSYAGFFFALYLVAHVVARATRAVRRPVPAADGGAADGDRADRDLPPRPDDAFRQGLWIVIGVALFAAHAARCCAATTGGSSATSTSSGSARSSLLVLPALPGIGADGQRRAPLGRVGPFQFQPGELAKIMLIVFLAGYLREKREVLAQGRLKDFGPLLLIWGGAMLVLVQTNDLGSALLYFGIFLGDALRRHRPRARSSSAGLALFVGGAAVVYQLDRRGSRSGSRSGSTRGRDAQDEGYQLVQSLYSIANGGFGGTGLGQGTFTTTGGDAADPVRRRPTSSTPRSRRSSGSSAPPRCCSSTCSSSLRGFRVALLRRRRLLEAARGRASPSASRCRPSSSSAASCA